MSAPVINVPERPICREQAITDVIESIALEETGIAHILNAEGEKIQKALELSCCVEDLERINTSVKETLTVITGLECALKEKLEIISSRIQK